MKIDEIKKAIRGLIREEVKKAVAEEVSKAMGKVLVEMVKEIKTNNSPRITENIEEGVDEIPEVIHTKNPKLNSVLAETARYSKPLPRTTGGSSNLVGLMSEFEKIGKTEDINTIGVPSKNMDFLKQIVGTNPSINQPSALDGGEEVPDVLKKVFKKDFRSFMKKMDEAKPGGFIDPSKILTG